MSSNALTGLIASNSIELQTLDNPEKTSALAHELLCLSDTKKSDDMRFAHRFVGAKVMKPPSAALRPQFPLSKF